MIILNIFHMRIMFTWIYKRPTVAKQDWKREKWTLTLFHFMTYYIGVAFKNLIEHFKNYILLLLETLSWISNSIPNSTYQKINTWYNHQKRFHSQWSSSPGPATTCFMILRAKSVESSMTPLSQSHFTSNPPRNAVGSTLKVHQ